MENVEGIILLSNLIPYARISEDVVLFISKYEPVNPETPAVQVNFFMQKIDAVQTLAQYRKTQSYTIVSSRQFDDYYHFLLRKKFTTKELARMLMNYSDALNHKMVYNHFAHSH